jgi:hypothetical protein
MWAETPLKNLLNDAYRVVHLQLMPCSFYYVKLCFVQELSTLYEHESVTWVHPVHVSVDEHYGWTQWVLRNNRQPIDQRLSSVCTYLQYAIKSVLPTRRPQKHLVEVVFDLLNLLLMCQSLHSALYECPQEALSPILATPSEDMEGCVVSFPHSVDHLGCNLPCHVVEVRCKVVNIIVFRLFRDAYW